MPSKVSLRTLQTALGGAYAVLAAVAVIEASSLATLLIAVAAMLVSYLTARTIPDAQVSWDAAFGVCAIGLAIICVGLVGVFVGRPDALRWVAIVMAYCGGNRLRAAGLGPAR